MTLARALGRDRRHRRIRKRVVGLPNRPRLCVFRSNKHLYAQVINDFENKTLFSCTTNASRLNERFKRPGTIGAAEQLGRLLAEEAIKRGIRQVVFDRGGYRYHGRVKALAEAARQSGLQF